MESPRRQPDEIKVADYLTTEQMLDRLGISSTTLALRVKEGRFHPVRMGKRLLYSPEEEAEEYRRITETNQIKRGRPRKPVSPPTTSPSTNTDERPRKAQSPKAMNIPAPPEKYTGEMAQASIKIFEEGKDAIEVVKQMAVTFHLALHLQESYELILSKRQKKEFTLDAEIFEWMRGYFSWKETPPTMAGLKKAIIAKVDALCEQAAREAVAAVTPEPSPSPEPPTTPESPPPLPEPPAMPPEQPHAQEPPAPEQPHADQESQQKAA